ncbi:hypothetical protein M406DRAFT_327056 [Cryphonectria parasitica EP155]|uniref:Uncharacterized protein n=1 Tax=Cryphonectria parasitica (strain ATCC 38755 / EP155) TaxID=660469 RepID=A0A9P4Y905_CRYP1|nr:uncharacterized protein M406DRAFT_327056 [Cryphonectria parasitica EP155]KAF3768629.1 hypothetical protein M406DRAFT_327056 [Cryphonectria parasitica EP155]
MPIKGQSEALFPIPLEIYFSPAPSSSALDPFILSKPQARGVTIGLQMSPQVIPDASSSNRDSLATVNIPSTFPPAITSKLPSTADALWNRKSTSRLPPQKRVHTTRQKKSRVSLELATDELEYQLVQTAVVVQFSLAPSERLARNLPDAGKHRGRSAVGELHATMMNHERQKGVKNFAKNTGEMWDER